jgi:hypothetical protein
VFASATRQPIALRIAARRKKKVVEHDALAQVIDAEARSRED